MSPSRRLVRRIEPIVVLGVAVLMGPMPAGAQYQFDVVKLLRPTLPEGYAPAGPMVQTTGGWVYGLTDGYGDPSAGSSSQYPSVFRFQPSDPEASFETVLRLHEYSVAHGMDARWVEDGGLVAAGDGNLYFVTAGGCGSAFVFRVVPEGEATALRSLGCGSSLRNPSYGLTVGLDGALYGLALVGGAHGAGGVYRVALDGTLSEVASFPGTFGAALNGAPLTAGSDGRFYGAMATATRQFVYRVDPLTGVAESAYELRAAGLDGTPYPDGRSPRGRLLEVPPAAGQDVAFVGVTSEGGAGNAGVIFRVDLAGDTATYTRLYSFDPVAPYSGRAPRAGLVRAGDGLLYGTTFGSGGRVPGAYGTVYRLGIDGVPTPVHEGNIQPLAPLLVGEDGGLYGTSSQDPQDPPGSTWGSLFRLSRAAGRSYLSSLQLSSPLLSGCRKSTGKVTLLEPAPSGGLVVTLHSDNPHVVVPATLTLKAGTVAKTFAILTSAVASPEAATIQASVAPQVLSSALTLKPMAPASVSLSPNPVVGGLSVAGTVTLECAAGPGDIVVTLTSSKPTVASPTASSVTVPVGSTSVPFVATTALVPVVTKPAIKATANGVTKSKALVVNPAP